MAHISESRFQGTRGVDLFRKTWSSEKEGIADLVLIHGIGEHCERYTNLIDALVGRGYRISAFDLRWHGKSSGKRGLIQSWDDFRQDIRIFIDIVRKETGADEIFLLGHSLGGLIVLNYALYYPEHLKGVIASAPALAQKGVSPVTMTLAKVLSHITPGLTLKTGLDVSAISRDPGVVQAYIQDPLVHSKGTPRLGAEMQATMDWTNAHAGDFKLPILIVHGDADRIVPQESSLSFYERIKSTDKQRIVYPSGFHESHNDIHHDQVMKDIVAWLDSHQE